MTTYTEAGCPTPDDCPDPYHTNHKHSWQPQSKSQQDKLPDLNNLKGELEKILDELVYQCTNHRLLPSKHTEGTLPKEQFNGATQDILDHISDYLNRVVPEIIGEDETVKVLPNGLYSRDMDMAAARQQLKNEQRKKWDEIQKGIKGE